MQVDLRGSTMARGSSLRQAETRGYVTVLGYDARKEDGRAEWSSVLGLDPEHGCYGFERVLTDDVFPVVVRCADSVSRRGTRDAEERGDCCTRVTLCLSADDKKLHHRLPNRLPLPFGVILPRNAWVVTPT
jgi:hypothetical protein